MVVDCRQMHFVLLTEPSEEAPRNAYAGVMLRLHGSAVDDVGKTEHLRTACAGVRIKADRIQKEVNRTSPHFTLFPCFPIQSFRSAQPEIACLKSFTGCYWKFFLFRFEYFVIGALAIVGVFAKI